MAENIDDDEDRDTLPLHRQRYFGAGIKRKRVDFVRATSPSNDGLAGTLVAAETERSGDAKADAYLSIVLGQRSASLPPTAASPVTVDLIESSRTQQQLNAPPPLDRPSSLPPSILEEGEEEKKDQMYECVACAKRVRKAKPGELPHEASLSHQVVALQHSHPPSSIDRQSKGFSYMSSYGWDPDQRKGLGAEGAGRLYPVRAVDKQDTLGIGAEKVDKIARARVEHLDAGQVRKMEVQKAKRAKRLQQLLHGRDDVNKYLGIDP